MADGSRALRRSALSVAGFEAREAPLVIGEAASELESQRVDLHVGCRLDFGNEPDVLPKALGHHIEVAAGPLAFLPHLGPRRQGGDGGLQIRSGGYSWQNLLHCAYSPIETSEQPLRFHWIHPRLRILPSSGSTRRAADRDRTAGIAVAPVECGE